MVFFIEDAFHGSPFREYHEMLLFLIREITKFTLSKFSFRPSRFGAINTLQVSFGYFIGGEKIILSLTFPGFIKYFNPIKSNISFEFLGVQII